MPLITLTTAAPYAVYSQQIAAIAHAMSTHLDKNLPAIRSLVLHQDASAEPHIAMRGLHQPEASSLYDFAQAVAEKTGLIFTAEHYHAHTPTQWFAGSLPILRAKSGEEELRHGRFPLHAAQQVTQSMPTLLVQTQAALVPSTAQAIASITADVMLDYALDGDPPVHLKTIIAPEATRNQLTLYCLDNATRKQVDEATQALTQAISRHTSTQMHGQSVRLSTQQLFIGAEPMCMGELA